MKKLVLLMLVVGIVSMANAGLTLNIGGQSHQGEITLNPSDTFVLSAVAAAGFGLGDFQISLSNAQGKLDATGATFSEVYDVSGGAGYTVAWGIAWLPVGNLLDDDQHFSLGGGNLPPTVTTIDEIVMDGLVFHCEERTDVIITLEEYLGGGEYELLDTIIVHQIPEPITMGLLGVGGLFLRKRK